MRKNYAIKIHDMTTNRIHVYEVLAISFEDAFLQAKVLHNHFMYILKGNAELISIIKKQNNENE
jgi:hypothetical protein